MTTFLIADIRGYTSFTLERGDAAAKQLTARFAEIATEVVGARGGRVAEVRGDEVLAVFTSARQALRAALDLQTRCASETSDGSPLNVGVGLDAGEALPVAEGFRGAALNLAARLCSIAGPGEILASDTIVNLARKVDGIDYAEAGDVVPKGFSERVRVFRISDSGSESAKVGDTAEVELEAPDLPIGGFLGSLPSTELVGRQEELARIAVNLREAKAASGRLVLLAGEPGVGKTRLAQEVTLQLRNRGFLIAAGACYESRQATAFAPFMEVLSAAFAAARESIRSVAGRRWPYLAKLLPGEDLQIAGADGSDEKERLFWAVTGFLQTVAAEHPLALLLDDLHWADGSSLELLQHLARHTRGNRVFILGTYRDVEVGRRHPLEATLRELGRQELVDKVAVLRLDQTDTAQFVAASFDETEVSDEFSDLLYRRTDGNPFFLQQVLRALVERGDVYRLASGVWDRRAVGEIEVPESVRSVIGQRLSRLAETSQSVLTEASVLGQSFAFDELQGMTDRSEQEIEAALEEAGSAGLLRYEPHDRYAFDHALTQGTLYAELSPRRKRRLHLMAGESLLRLADEERAGRVAELAWHFTKGDDSERALHFSLLAGDSAEGLFAHSDAEWHYRTAVELALELTDEIHRAEASFKLGNVLITLARHDEALQALETAAESYSTAGSLDEERLSLASIGRAHAFRGTFEEGLNRLSPALRALEAEAPDAATVSTADLYAAVAMLNFRASRYPQELEAAEKASELARAVGDERLLAASEVERATALASLGRPHESLEVMRGAIELAERVGNLKALQRGLNNMASILWNIDEFKQAEPYSIRALDLAQQVGDPAYIAFFLCVRGLYPFVFGQWDLALERLEQAAAVARSIGASHASWVQIAPCYVLVNRGLDAEVQKQVGEALAFAEKYGEPRVPIVASWMMAENHVMQERNDEAISILEPLSSLPDLRDDDRRNILRTLMRAYLQRGDLNAAKSASDTIEPLMVTAYWTRCELATSLGMLLSLRGQHELAGASYQLALERARKVPYPFGEALALYTWGSTDLTRGEGGRAIERLSSALTIFQRLGAETLANRCERELSKATALTNR